MRRLLACAAGAALFSVAPPAGAQPAYDYVGGCRIVSVGERADASTGRTWTAEVHAYVVATELSGVPAAAPIEVECVLFLSGERHASVLRAAGTGAAGNAGTVRFGAPADVQIDLCQFVTLPGGGRTFCDTYGGLDTTPVTDLLDPTP